MDKQTRNAFIMAAAAVLIFILIFVALDEEGQL